MMKSIAIKDLSVRDEVIIDDVDVHVWECTKVGENLYRVHGTNYSLPGHVPYLKDLPGTKVVRWIVDGAEESMRLKEYRNRVGSDAEVAALNAYERQLFGDDR
jgi:hypothetical protein